MRTLFKFTTTFLLAMLAWTCSHAAQNVTYNWTAPTTGAAVDHYIVQVDIGGVWSTVDDNVTDTSFVYLAQDDVEHRVRVAGVDALGRQGPWSEASDPYTPLGPPGAPGKPRIIAVVLGLLMLLAGLLFGRKKGAGDE